MTVPSSGQLIREGLALHQAGKFAEAEAVYGEALKEDPDNARLLDLLGVLAFQTGRLDLAVELIERSIAIAPDAAEVHGHLGLVLVAKGKVVEAIDSYRRALALRADMPDVQNNLGNALRKIGKNDHAIAAYRAALAIREDFAEAYHNLGLSLADKGEIDAAIQCYLRSTSLRSDDVEGWYNLGVALCAKGDYPGATAALEKAIHLRQDYPEALNNLGHVLLEAGKLAEAIAHYRRAIELRPDFADAGYNLSIALQKTGKTEAAIDESRNAISLRPCFSEAHNNLGILLQAQGDLPGSIEAFRAALSARPDNAEAHNNLGNVLRLSGQIPEAIASYRRAVMIRSCYPEAHNNLGSALQQAGRLAEAISSYRRALEDKPDLAEAHNNIGNAFKDQAELDEAIASYTRAANLSPHDPAPDSNRLYTLHFHPDYTAAQILQEHLAWNRRHAEGFSQAVRSHDNDPNPNRRLRIGYVSPYFREHCHALFLAPLLSNHDRKSVEVVCYSDVVCPDAVTTRLKGCADVWREVVGISDHQLTEQVRQDRIDVLVDLSVHMAHNRLLAFARKPAPVQVTWLGYPSTTGLGAMDYRLSDLHLDPESPQRDELYSERTIRLPESFWCYDPLAGGPEINELPLLRSGHVTFGCLNNFCKVTDPTVKLWAQTMSAVKESRLLVLIPRGPAREHLLEKLQRNGIAPTRIEFADRCPRNKYLELYRRIDIGLDTFPYNGHTTTLDAMWMGVPVVSVVGRTAVGRGGWSQLCNLGLKGLAARSYGQFARIAADLAYDRHRLASLRATLRDRLTRSPLMDAQSFARNMEAAYRRMWQAWATDEPRPLAIPA
jgi:predicted O-linked N-acetylglucosamine transferase (SPINDLY family)